MSQIELRTPKERTVILIIATLSLFFLISSLVLSFKLGRQNGIEILCKDKQLYYNYLTEEYFCSDKSLDELNNKKPFVLNQTVVLQ